MSQPFEWKTLLCIVALLCASVRPAAAIDTKRSDVKDFIAHMADTYSFKKRALRKLLDSAQSQPAIIDAMSKPAEKAKLWYEYRPIFITDRRIRE
jgi:membrane-bound lytic murein transglycosylase B